MYKIEVNYLILMSSTLATIETWLLSQTTYPLPQPVPLVL